MTLGTRLRNMHGPRLEVLEAEIEALPFKIEIKGINLKPNGEWYIHFTLEDSVVYRAQNEVGTNSPTGEVPDINKQTKKNKGTK